MESAARGSGRMIGNTFKNAIGLAIRGVGARCWDLQSDYHMALAELPCSEQLLPAADEPSSKTDEERSPELSIDSLPPEILAHVLDNLNPLDVVSAAGVCTAWLEVSNSLVLAPRGHLVLHGRGRHSQPGPGRRHPATITTVHVVNAPDVPAALAWVAAELQTVRVVWLHDQGGALRDAASLRTEATLRATLNAIFDACPEVTSVNFVNMAQTAMLLRLLVDRGPRPRFRTRCVFTERDHNARGAQDVIAELSAFFQEAVVATLRPVLSITAQYPHYWSPASRLRLPFHRDARVLTLHAAGLRSSALRDICRMPNLRALHLYDAESLDDESLSAILESVRRLSRLAIHDAPSVSSASWTAALQSECLAQLESLQLSACPQLDDESFNLTSPMRALTYLELDLEVCSKLSGIGVRRLIGNLPNVEALTIAAPFSPSITDGLSEAPQIIPCLKKLRIRLQGSIWQGDPQVAVSSVEELKQRLRRTCSHQVQMDVTLTFIKLGMAESNSPDDQVEDDIDAA